MHQIEYLVELAVMDDEKGQRSEAEKMYTSAIDLALQAVSQLNNRGEGRVFFPTFEIMLQWNLSIVDTLET